MSTLRSIIRNLRLILQRDLGEDLEALRHRLETRSDRYEKAIDERLELRLGTTEADLARRTSDLAAEISRERARTDGVIESITRRLNDLEEMIGERFQVMQQRADERLDSKFIEVQSALDQRSTGYEQALDRRVDERLIALETSLDCRSVDHQQNLDHRFDERLEALRGELSRHFSEHSRAVDVRLDDRQIGTDRRIDDFLRNLEKRIDARHEAHELRIDQTLVSNRDDIIERTDLLLQVFDQRLDRLRTTSPGQSGEAGLASIDQLTENPHPPKSSITEQIYDWNRVSTSGLNQYSPDEQEIVDYILSFIDDPAARDYINQHMRRYLSTLHRIPPARRSGEQVLELGSLTPLAPAIRRYCGYQSVAGNNYWVGEERTAEKVFVQTGGEERFAITLHNFNVEVDRFPFPDGTFRVVLCGELLEHLQRDPLHMLWECNRVLAEDGQLVLTTPNIAGCRSIEGVLTGCSPYLFSQYNLASSFDQHHREYAPREVRTALNAAGFEVLKLETEDVWSRSNPVILQILESLGLPTELRGDNIFVIARKAGPPVERYPRELYID